MAANFNPALDFMKGYQFMEGVQDRRHARERLRTLEQREDVLWERGTEEWEREQRERELKNLVAAMTGAMVNEKGELDPARAEAFLKNPDMRPAVLMAIEDVTGRRPVDFRLVRHPQDPSGESLVAVVEHEDGTEDVLAEGPGDDDRVVDFNLKNMPGIAGMLLARYQPEAFNSYLEQLRAQAEGERAAQAWDAMGGGGRGRGLGAATVPPAGGASAVDGMPGFQTPGLLAAPSAPLGQTAAAQQGLTPDEMAAEPPGRQQAPPPDLPRQVRNYLGWESVPDAKFKQLIDGASPAELQEFLTQRGSELTDRQKDLVTTAMQERANPPQRGLTSALLQPGPFGSVFQGPADRVPQRSNNLLAVAPQDLIEGGAQPEAPSAPRTLDAATAAAIKAESDPNKKLQMAREAGIPEDQIPQPIKAREGKPRPPRAGGMQPVSAPAPGSKPTPRQANAAIAEGEQVRGERAPDELRKAIREMLLHGDITLEDAKALLAGPELKMVKNTNTHMIGFDEHGAVMFRIPLGPKAPTVEDQLARLRHNREEAKFRQQWVDKAGEWFDPDEQRDDYNWLRGAIAISVTDGVLDPYKPEFSTAIIDKATTAIRHDRDGFLWFNREYRDYPSLTIPYLAMSLSESGDVDIKGTIEDITPSAEVLAKAKAEGFSKKDLVVHIATTAQRLIGDGHRPNEAMLMAKEAAKQRFSNE